MKIRMTLALALALGACGGGEPPVAEATLPINYDLVTLADLDTVDKLAARCEADEGAFRQRMAEIEDFGGTPGVDNYLKPLDSLYFSALTLQFHVSSLSRVHPEAELRSAAEACDLAMQAFTTELGMSRAIFDAMNAIDASDADAVTRHVLDKSLLSARIAGVDKDEATRTRIRALNDEIAAIGQEFDRNIREDVRYLELESVDDLAGLPDDYIAAHPLNEDGRILISTQYPDVFPFFEYAERDDLRREMLLLFNSRAYPQNEEVLRRLIEARYELAQLAGFDNYAQLVTADKMSGSPGRVADFLADLKSYTTDTQDAEFEVLLARLREEQPDAERLEAWQTSYIRSKVRREQYDVDTKVIREYFNYESSRDGILTLVQDLFGVQIVPWETETWHEDVEAFELRDGDEAIGRFYLDMHPREGKYQHAAMFPFVNGIRGQHLPVAGLICNFPSGTEPMQHGQVVTFLHEFGHLLHWMFAGHQDWMAASGITAEWDFVEAPSQMLEEWIWDYDTISVFAKKANGDVLPKPLFDRMLDARDFGLGMGTRGQLSYAGMSLGLYDRDPSEVDFDEHTASMIRTYTRFEPLEGSHMWASFGHLNGYSAIYYTYQWSKAIAQDMFTRFSEGGLRNTEIAQAYRNKVLAAGGSRPAEESVVDFLGRPISFETYADRLRGSNKD
jgi:thimet oligopeptidase